MTYKEYSLGKLRYLIHYPDCFDPQGPNPILFHLNGAGSRGDDIAFCLDAKPVTLGAEVFPEYPFVTVVPSVPRIFGLICGSIWRSWYAILRLSPIPTETEST